MGAAVTAFCQYLEEIRCIKEDSVRGAAQKLAWLPPDALLVSIKPEQAERLYRELVQSVNPRNKKPPSTATQRARLTTARYFFSWAQKSGLCRQNPFAGVQPIGRMNVGKKQLRIDEARRFEAVCLKQAESGDTAAFGALLMIYLGLRQSEVAARVKRDIDDEGRVLWIPSGKTKNAKRRLKIPEHLRPLLLTLITEKESEDRLFYPPNRKRSSSYYWAHVRRLCRLADPFWRSSCSWPRLGHHPRRLAPRRPHLTRCSASSGSNPPGRSCSIAASTPRRTETPRGGSESPRRTACLQ